MSTQDTATHTVRQNMSWVCFLHHLPPTPAAPFSSLKLKTWALRRNKRFARGRQVAQASPCLHFSFYIPLGPLGSPELRRSVSANGELKYGPPGHARLKAKGDERVYPMISSGHWPPEVQGTSQVLGSVMEWLVLLHCEWGALPGRADGPKPSRAIQASSPFL